MLISPFAEETGLLLKDQATVWRFNRQCRMLNKAKQTCEKNNINIKQISLKLVAPLLEYSGLEDNDEMLDNWAFLLSNLVDSDQNIQNHVFPYLLSQISKNEFDVLKTAYLSHIEKINLTRQNLEYSVKIIPHTINELKEQKTQLRSEIFAIDEANTLSEEQLKRKRVLQLRLDEVLDQINTIKSGGSIATVMNILQAAPIIVYYDAIDAVQTSNLERLGLIKEVAEHKVLTNNPVLQKPLAQILKPQPLVELETEETILLTALGEVFIKACLEKIYSV